MVYIGQIRRAPDGTEVVVESIEDWLGPAAVRESKPEELLP